MRMAQFMIKSAVIKVMALYPVGLKVVYFDDKQVQLYASIVDDCQSWTLDMTWSQAVKEIDTALNWEPAKAVNPLVVGTDGQQWAHRQNERMRTLIDDAYEADVLKSDETEGEGSEE